jgi:hypothetical protein
MSCGAGTIPLGNECVPALGQAGNPAAGAAGHAGTAAHAGTAGAAGNQAGAAGKAAGGASGGQAGAATGGAAGHAGNAGPGGSAGTGGQASAGGSPEGGAGGSPEGGAGGSNAAGAGGDAAGSTGSAGAGSSGGAGSSQETGYGGLPIPPPSGSCSVSVAAQDPAPADNAIDPTFSPLDLGWDRNWDSSLLFVRYRQEDLCRPTPDFDHHNIHNLAEAKASDGSTDFEACEYGTDFFWCDMGPDGCLSTPFGQLDLQGKKDWINGSCNGKWKAFTKPADGGAPYFLHRQQHGAWFLAARATNRPDTVTTMVGTGDATHITNSSCNNLMDGSHRLAPRQPMTGTPQIHLDGAGNIAVQSVKGAILRLYRVGGADEASKVKNSVRLDSVMAATDGTATFCPPGGGFDPGARYVVSAQNAGEQESFMMNAVSLDGGSAPARLQLEVQVTLAEASLQPPPGYQSRWYQPKPELPDNAEFEVVSTVNHATSGDEAYRAYYATLTDLVGYTITVKSAGNPVPFAMAASNYAYGVVPIMADAWNLWSFLPKEMQDAMTRTPQDWQDYETSPWLVDWAPGASQSMRDSLNDASPKTLWLPKGRAQQINIRVNPTDPNNYQVTTAVITP